MPLRSPAMVLRAQPVRRAVRGLCGACLCAAMSLGPIAAQAAVQVRTPGCDTWPGWQTFKRQFVSADGRVIDPASARAHTTSEGQSYALFFALVANDRPGFARLLEWTENNLAAGDLSARLPAWQWGRRDDGTWQVVDPNAAADADLWMVYALGEAGRLWGERRYIGLASLLAERVLREETAIVPGLGRVLLPGPQGFGPWQREGRTRARLNASYLPLPILRWLALRSASPAWAAVLQSSLRVLTDGAPKGFAADWVSVDGGGPAGVQWGLGDTAEERVGAYDAIRVYLWLGLTAADDPASPGLLRHYLPMLAEIETSGSVPRAIDAATGRRDGQGSPGFTAAMLPFIARQGRPELVGRLAEQVKAVPAQADAYYDQALTLFALGWREQRYRFEADGTLKPGWIACNESSPSSH
jgi:endoglucanase